MCVIDSNKVKSIECAHVPEPTPAFLHRSRLITGCLFLGTRIVHCVGKIGLAAVSTTDCVTNLVIGRFFGCFFESLSESVVSLARRVHLVCPLQSDEEFAKNSSLLLEAILSQLSTFSEKIKFPVIPVTSAAKTMGVITIFAAEEELIFREVVQQLLLKQIPQFVLERVSPGTEALLDTKIYTVARIAFTASFFALVHLSNSGVVPDCFVQAQVISAFAAGILFGIIKESSLGLLGAIASHVQNNLQAFGSNLSTTGNN
jgi:hypothetical protein